MEPGAKHQSVVVVVLDLLDPLCTRENAVEKAHLAVVGLKLDRAGLPERLVKVQILLLAQGIDLKLEAFAECFDPVELTEDQDILAQRRGQFSDLSVLSDLSHLPSRRTGNSCLSNVADIRFNFN